MQNPHGMFMVAIRNKVTSPKTIVLKSNVDSKTKIMVIGDSLVKYLRREEFSSKKKTVKVIAHPGSATENMLDYIKLTARRKPDTLIIHNGTNGPSNGVNTIKKRKKTNQS